MSLINEALKRAQSQKSAPPPAAGSPPVGSPPPPPPTPVGTPVPGIITLLLVGGTILAVFTLGAGLIIWGLRSDRGPTPEPVRIAAEMPVAPAAPAPSLPILDEPSPSPSSSPSSSSSPLERREGSPQEDSSPLAAPPPPVLPPAIPPAPAPPVVSSPPPATVAATAPSAPVPVPDRERPAPQPEPPPPAPPAPPQPDPAILGFLSEIEIRGIMAGLQRVLIFNPADNRSSAFETGAVFSRDPLLTIKEIRQRSIIFEDKNGLSYEKRF